MEETGTGFLSSIAYGAAGRPKFKNSKRRVIPKSVAGISSIHWNQTTLKWGMVARGQGTYGRTLEPQNVGLMGKGDRSGIASFQRSQSFVPNSSSMTWYIDYSALSHMTNIFPFPTFHRITTLGLRWGTGAQMQRDVVYLNCESKYQGQQEKLFRRRGVFIWSPVLIHACWKAGQTELNQFFPLLSVLISQRLKTLCIWKVSRDLQYFPYLQRLRHQRLGLLLASKHCMNA